MQFFVSRFTDITAWNGGPGLVYLKAGSPAAVLALMWTDTITAYEHT